MSDLKAIMAAVFIVGFLSLAIFFGLRPVPHEVKQSIAVVEPQKDQFGGALFTNNQTINASDPLGLYETNISEVSFKQAMQTPRKWASTLQFHMYVWGTKVLYDPANGRLYYQSGQDIYAWDNETPERLFPHMNGEEFQAGFGKDYKPYSGGYSGSYASYVPASVDYSYPIPASRYIDAPRPSYCPPTSVFVNQIGDTAYVNTFGGNGSASGTSTRIGNTIFHNYHGSDGSAASGTTEIIGDSAFTTINGY